jgi:DNA-binding beta-propeller fold protein YncE
VHTLRFSLRSVSGAALLGCAFAVSSVATAAAVVRVAPERAGIPYAARADRSAPLVYVASPNNNTIYMFDSKGRPAGTITDRISVPIGIFVDAGHNLWVANYGAQNVLMFARGAEIPSMQIADANGPSDVGQCPNGTILVADELNDGGVTVYPPGSTKPKHRLVAEGGSMEGWASSVTCDRKGNVFAVGQAVPAPYEAIMGWMHAKQSGYILFPLDDYYRESIVATKSGTLLVSGFNHHSQPTIIEYDEAGKATGRSVMVGKELWTGLALDIKHNVVYGAVPDSDMGASIAFPSGAAGLSYSASGISFPQGIAFDPGG